MSKAFFYFCASGLALRAISHRRSHYLHLIIVEAEIGPHYGGAVSNRHKRTDGEVQRFPVVALIEHLGPFSKTELLMTRLTNYFL
jgi:hypothetical protein